MVKKKIEERPKIKYITFTDNKSYFELASQDNIDIRKVEYCNNHKEIFVTYREHPKKRKPGRPKKKVAVEV